MHLNSNHHDDVHDSHCREAEDEPIGFAMAVQLLRHREHLHASVDQRRHGEQPCADHGYDQVTDIVLGERQAAAQQREGAKQVRILPLVWRGHGVMWHQAEMTNSHLSGHEQPDQEMHQVQFPYLGFQRSTAECEK